MKKTQTKESHATVPLSKINIKHFREVSSEMCEVIIEQSVDKKCSDIEQQEFREAFKCRLYLNLQSSLSA